MSIRKLFVALAVAASMTSGSPAIAEEVEPDPTTTQGYTSEHGEYGFQTVTLNVVIPETRNRSTNDVLIKIAGDCEFNTQGVPNTSDVILYVAAHASSTPSSQGYPVATGIICNVFNEFGALEVREATSGNTTADVGTLRVRISPFTVCAKVEVYYDEAYFVTHKTRCTST